MEILIAIVLFGALFALFATQNITPVIVQLAQYSFALPLYLVVIISLFIGLFMSMILSIIQDFSTSLTIWGKENNIKKAEGKIQDLTQYIHKLEVENASLKTKVEERGKNYSAKTPSKSYI